MNKELLTIALAFGCIAANATTNNYDLLGRKGSKMNSPMVYKNVDYSKAKKNEQQKLGSSLENRGLAKQAVGLKDGVKAIVGWSGPNGYGFKTCTGNGSGCGFLSYVGGGSISTYLNKANKAFIPVYTDNRPINNNDYIYDWIDGATLTGYSGYTMEEYPYDMPQNEFLSHASYGTINSLLNRNYRANSNVGVYMAEKGLPVRLNPVTDPNPSPFIIADNNAVIQSFSTTVGHEMDASRMYKLLHRFSDRSVVYSTKTRPSNPAEHRLGPQIYMGVHGYGGSAKTSYNAMAQSLDNYIYNNRTVEIVAAGNNANKLSAEGFAVNAITVGALDPLTGKKASYSGERNLDLEDCYEEECYVKPDIYSYSNFYIDDFYRVYSLSSHTYEYKPFYEGTEAATGVTAGMISDLLSYNGFYKWHPEVLKAVLLNLNTKPDYNALVFNNREYNTDHDRSNTHISAYFIGDVNSLMKVEFGRKLIRLELPQGEFASASNYSSVVGYDIAIAWLNSGNDIANLGGLPQKFNLYASGTGSSRPEHWFDSESPKGAPYRKAWVRRSDDQNNRVTIEIVLEEEDTRSENYGQMVLGLDIMPYYQ